MKRLDCVFFIVDLHFKGGQPGSAWLICSLLSNIVFTLQLAPDVNIESLAQVTHGYSGSDLHELCRVAATTAVRESIRSGTQIQVRHGGAIMFLFFFRICSSLAPLFNIVDAHEALGGRATGRGSLAQ